MSSKTFKIILAGDAKGATAAVKDAQKAGDGLISSSSSWSSKWSSAFTGMGQKLSDFGSKFSQADGWKAKLQVLGDSGSASLSGLGDKFAGLGTAAAAGMALAGVAIAGLAALAFTKVQEIGGYMYALGEQFYAALGTLRVGTGATGSELDGLSESFYNVYEKTTKGSNEVAAAMTLVEQKLNASGKPLEDLTLGFLRLSSLTGTDVTANITSVGRAYGDWGIAAEDQLATQDKLFRAWQESGVPIDQLTGTVVQYGTSLRGLGYSFDDALAMTAKWNEEGVNTELVMGGLKKAFGAFAEEYGSNAGPEFQKFMDQIAAAPNAFAAAAIAQDKLGVIKGADFAAAVQEGRFAYGDFQDVIANGSDTMAKAATDTGNWRSSITLMVHTLEAKLGPAAERVFGVINDVVRKNIMPLFRGLSTAWDEGGFVGVFEALPATLGLVQVKVGEWWETFKVWLSDHAPEMIHGLVEGLKAAGAAFVGLNQWLGERLGEWLPAFGEWIQNTAMPYIEQHWGEWWKSFTDSFNDGGFMNTAISKLNEVLVALGGWIITDALPWAGAKSLEILWALTKWLGTDGIPTLVSGLFTLLGAGIEWIETSGASMVADAGRSMWHGIANGFAEMLNRIIQMWNDFSISVPTIDLGPLGTYGGGSIDTPQIGYLPTDRAAATNTGFKRFAEGGVVTRPTFGLIGEDSRTTPEIVTPEALMRKVVREEAGRGGGRMVVQVVLDKRVVGEALIDMFRGREMALR